MQNAGLFVRLGIGTLTFVLLWSQPFAAAAQQPGSTPPASAQSGQQPAQKLPIPETAWEPEGFLEEPEVVTRAVLFADRNVGTGKLTNGFYVDFSNMIPGAGWISAGPGYRRWSSQDRIYVDGSAAISWHGYKTAQAQFELPRLAGGRLAVGSQFRWQDYPQVNFFGIGPNTPESNESEYRLRSNNIVGYASFRPWRTGSFNGELGVLDPSVLPRAGFFKAADIPDAEDVFPDNLVFAVDDQPTFIYGDASFVADTRDFPGHPLKGGLYRAAASYYSDRDDGLFSFRRYEVEGGHFVPLADSRVVVALRGLLVTSDPGAGQVVPFYLQPALGGNNSLRGYADYRFQDRNALLVNAELRIAAMTHVDGAFFFDAGSVAPRVGDLNFDKRDWGAGIRLHSRRQTYVRLDVAHSDEGWRVWFRLNDPLQFTRVLLRTAPVPFVP